MYMLRAPSPTDLFYFLVQVYNGPSHFSLCSTFLDLFSFSHEELTTAYRFGNDLIRAEKKEWAAYLLQPQTVLYLLMQQHLPPPRNFVAVDLCLFHPVEVFRIKKKNPFGTHVEGYTFIHIKLIVKT